MKIIKEKGFDIIVDDDVYEWASKKKWTIEDVGYTQYARAKVDGSVKRMHRIIMGLKDPSIVVDHINGNGLDNRRCNLRACSVAENNKNKRNYLKNGKGTSGFLGVYWKKTKNKYEAHIKHNGKMIYLGLFENEIDAAMAYNVAALKFRGEYASLNDM